MTGRVTFREYGIITAICWLSGLVLGTPLYFVLEGPLTLEWWVFLPFALPAAGMIALPYAALAGILACIVLLLSQRILKVASLRTWMIAGGICGAAIGAFHPLNLLGALVDYLVFGPQQSQQQLSWSFLGASAGSGALGGVLVAWWFRSRSLRDVVLPPLGPAVLGTQS